MVWVNCKLVAGGSPGLMIKGDEMTKSNNEWVPEIGATVMVKSYKSEFTVEAICGDFAWLKSKNGGGLGTYFIGDIIPIKTEAEKWREELTEAMRLDIISLWNYEGKDCPVNDFDLSKYLIKQNWIKPKPLTDDVITELFIAEFSPSNKCGITFAKAIEAYIRGEG